MSHWRIILHDDPEMKHWDAVVNKFKTKSEARQFLRESSGKLLSAMQEGRVAIIKQSNNKSNGNK